MIFNNNVNEIKDDKILFLRKKFSIIDLSIYERQSLDSSFIFSNKFRSIFRILFTSSVTIITRDCDIPFRV